jgi:signal transduction histidine kinase/CheY-like chemotaxis protein/HPt (histidine-containing phosphotransfer) domain-containing protein
VKGNDRVLTGHPPDPHGAEGPIRLICAVVGTLGLLALAGWVLDVALLKSILPRTVEMKANTAVALVLAAASLFLSGARQSRNSQYVAQLMAFAVAVVGLATLCEYFFDWHLGIDELLFRDNTNAYNPFRGRMSPYSAVVFVAIGVALAGVRIRGLRPLVLLGALFASIIGAASFLGYLWNASELTTDQWLPPVAVNTAAAFILLGLGTAFVDRAAARRALSQPAEIRGRVENKVLVGFILALVLLCLGGGITYRMQHNFEDSAQLLGVAQQYRTQLRALYTSIADAESAQRTYLLIGKLEYRQQFQDLARDTDDQIAQLRQHSADGPRRLAFLNEIEPLIKRRLESLSQHIDVFEREGNDAVRLAIATDDGVANMELIRRMIAQMDAQEAAVLTERAQKLAGNRGYTLIALLTTLAIATAGLLILFGSIVRDIRERARIARALHEAQQAAQKATQAKSQFLAAMSHEIRTPMNGVIGILELLQQSSLMGQQMEMVELIRESADSLLSIIDDILDFSKIEAGRLEIERVPMSVPEVAEKACSLLNRLAERKRTTLTVFCDPAIPPLVSGDATRLRQVLINLANNAIKFSSDLPHPGRVSVRAVLAESETHRVVVEFRVTDNGIGMDEATQAKVFSSFTQADTSTTRRYGGTGLGLAISEQLVALMGGSISVDSAAGRGSAFIVRIPFDVAQQAPRVAPKASVIEGLSCLVVGGQAGLADDLASYLVSEGASVGRVADASSAGDWTRTHQRALTVWVIEVGDELPAFDDFVRARSDLAVRVVLVVVGRGQRYPRAQADGFVIIDGNALNRHTLVKAVAIAGGRAATQIELAPARARINKSPPATREAAILERRLILVAEDNEINQKVIREQLHLLGYGVDVVPNGREALRQWRSGDYALLFADLHMPEMDGYDLTLAIRLAEGGKSRIPIIALTANALHGEAERCRAVGMDDYLSKPAPLAALAVTMNKWLAPLSSNRPEPTLRSPPVDVRALAELVGTDPQLISEFLREFGISAARLAVELADACRTKRPADASAVAHKLKSSARSVGAHKLGEICSAIEDAGNGSSAAALVGLLPKFEVEMTVVQEYLRSTHVHDLRPAQYA